MKGRYAVLLLAVLTASTEATDFQCKYHDGNGGDWMVAYKFPWVESTAFMAPGIPWKDSDMGEASPIGRTLNQYFELIAGGSQSTGDGGPLSAAEGGPLSAAEGGPLSAAEGGPLSAGGGGPLSDGDGDSPAHEAGVKQKPVGVIAYNQHPPSGAMVASLPGRGVLMVPDGTGMWIVHTFPQFPDLRDGKKYEKPTASNKAGMFVCVKISTAFDSIVEMLTYEAPLIYFLEGPNPRNNKWPRNVEDLVKGSASRVTPYAKQISLEISTSLTLKAFAKLSQAHLDIYSRFIAAVIKKSLRIWGQGDVKYKLPNYCNAFYKVEVLHGEFTLLNKKISNQYDSTVWLVSKGGKVWCVSNSPRLRTYEQYGNGVLCLENAEIYRAFKALADQTKSPQCPK